MKSNGFRSQVTCFLLSTDLINSKLAKSPYLSGYWFPHLATKFLFPSLLNWKGEEGVLLLPLSPDIAFCSFLLVF